MNNFNFKNELFFWKKEEFERGAVIRISIMKIEIERM